MAAMNNNNSIQVVLAESSLFLDGVNQRTVIVGYEYRVPVARCIVADQLWVLCTWTHPSFRDSW